MSNKTKIIIVVLLVAAVIITILGVISHKKPENIEANMNKENVTNIFDDYIDKEKSNITNDITENSIEQNSVTENKTNNKVQSNVNQNTVIGKEEQESNIENTELNDRQQAIELAKQEWAISVNSYDFQAELKEDKIYEVSVINKTDRNVITIYTVNLKTGTVTE